MYDAEILENKDIIYKNTISEFTEIFEKIKNLKQKIENEIEVLNDSHKKIRDKITENFEKEYQNLKEREKKAKSELDQKVEKMKNELENCLKESSDILLSCKNIYNSAQAYKNNVDE